MRKTQELGSPAVAAGIAIDYPQESEHITSPDYTFRIEAKRASQVEISIDNDAWRPCRQAEGYWWYDWSGYMPGKYQAAAKIRAQIDGQQSTSTLCAPGIGCASVVAR